MSRDHRAAWRTALAELALAFVGIFVGELCLWGLIQLGWLPTPMGPSPVWLLYGPARTALAAGVYMVLATGLDERALPEVMAREQRPGPALTAARMGLGIVAATVGSLVLSQLMALLGAPVEEQLAIRQLVEQIRETADVAGAAMLILSALVIAPVVEEWLFRGLLFGRVRERAGLVTAYLISALPFALVHGNVAGFVVYTWLGLVFAAVYHRTGRLWCAMVVHVANNSLAVTLLLLGPNPG